MHQTLPKTNQNATCRGDCNDHRTPHHHAPKDYVRCRDKHLRHGSLLIECAVAALILTTCSIALLKWIGTSEALNREADERVAATLIAENTASLLQQAPWADATSYSKRLAEETTLSSGRSVAIDSSNFETENTSGPSLNGIHFTITVETNDTRGVVRHTWIFEPDSSPPNASKIESSGAPSPPPLQTEAPNE